MKEKLYIALARRLNAVAYNDHVKNYEQAAKHVTAVLDLCREYLPSGSGFDCGSTVVVDKSTDNKLVIKTHYHHMVDGCYDGWTEHYVTVTPHLAHEIQVKVSGQNRHDVKPYIVEVFRNALFQEVED